MRLGIATIYQELDLVDGLSVAENIFLGHEKRPRGSCSAVTRTREARRLLGRLGHSEIPATRIVGRLSAAGKQIVSMARALSHDARLIVMDEPSAVLAHDEVDNLFRVIRDLTSSGVAVVYISHRLDEIRSVGHRVTVLKDGRTVATGLPARTTPTTEIVALMTGRTVEYAFPPRSTGGRAAPTCCGSKACRWPARSPTCPSPCGRGRSSASRVWSARAGRRCSRRCTAPAGVRRGR